MVMLEQRLVNVCGATLEVFVGGVADAPVVCETHSHDAVSADGGPVAEMAWVVRINPRGFGNSSPVRRPGDMTLDQLARDVEGVRRSLGIERWVYHGYSGSGYVGCLYALRYQSALAGLIIGGCPADMVSVVADPRSHFSPAYPAWAAKLAGWSPPRELATTVGSIGGWARVAPGLWACVADGQLRFILSGRDSTDPSERWRAAFAEAVLVDLSHRLSEIRVPTLYLHGRHDPAADVEHARDTCARLPDAELVIFEHSRHGLRWQEPEKWRSEIECFLAQRVARDPLG